MHSVNGIDENKSIDNSIKSTDYPSNGLQEHAVEINTPYSYIDESFGEKIVHSSSS